jgi:glutamate N-acetyltransferase/amino-acid N-acetyltransferase
MKRIREGTVLSPTAFTAATTTCGLKASGNPDLALIVSDVDCAAAGLFTQNQFAAAPVIVDQETLGRNNNRIRAVVANAGNANAGTGAPGLAHAKGMQVSAAKALNCQSDQVLVLSTGVIGIPLPIGQIETGIALAGTQLSAENGLAAAQAIMTTDTFTKSMALEVELPDGWVTIGGMAKGAGMIHPNMATMLAVITSDARISPEVMGDLLKQAADVSFNRISVDGDTSTNDTVLMLANGTSGITVGQGESKAVFGQALAQLCGELAQMIVRDGEGATKFVEIQVTGCVHDADAHAIAQTIATSPLVKTAFAGSDPNWGRILAAAGRAGVAFDQNLARMWIGGEDPLECQLVAAGTPTKYQESTAAAIFARPEFAIKLDLGAGEGAAIMWTTDLSHDYVTINADYRT